MVVDGTAARITDQATVQAFADQVNAKYQTSYGLDFFDPEVNACYRVAPNWVFGLTESDFEGSPTRWTFA